MLPDVCIQLHDPHAVSGTFNVSDSVAKEPWLHLLPWTHSGVQLWLSAPCESSQNPSGPPALANSGPQINTMLNNEI